MVLKKHYLSLISVKPECLFVYIKLRDSFFITWWNLKIVVSILIQSTPVISNSKGLTETLRDIRTSTYQSWESEENNKLNNHI